MEVNATKLAAIFQQFKVHTDSEASLQASLMRVLQESGVGFEREVRISDKDRIDFVVGKVGIEAKIKFSASDVTRQLHRYAQSDAIEELLLVTTRSKHLKVPAQMSGKPVSVCYVMRGLF